MAASKWHFGWHVGKPVRHSLASYLARASMRSSMSAPRDDTISHHDSADHNICGEEEDNSSEINTDTMSGSTAETPEASSDAVDGDKKQSGEIYWYAAEQAQEEAGTMPPSPRKSTVPDSVLGNLTRSTVASGVTPIRPQEKLELQKTKLVVAQAMSFVAAFLLTWVCTMIYQTFIMAEPTGNERVTKLIDSLLPLQGFLNVLVVLRPSFVQWYREQQKGGSKGLIGVLCCRRGKDEGATDAGMDTGRADRGSDR